VNKSWLFLTIHAIAALIGTSFSWKEAPGIAAKSSFPITEIYWANWQVNQLWQPIRFTVPDQDTTISTDGGELRRYDVHIAKMFEVTHYLCQNKHKHALLNSLNDKNVLATWKLKYLDSLLKGKRIDEGFSWRYEAAQGNVIMGNFDISCELAQDIASAYGLDEASPTTINRYYWVKESQQKFAVGKLASENYGIPTLRITGAKNQKWMGFVQTFKPRFSEYYRKVEIEKRTTPFPIAQALSKLRWKTEVPILLPNELPWMPIGEINPDRIQVNGDANGYTVCVSFPKVGCSRPTLGHFDSISAMRNGKLERPSHIGPLDTFREIELAGGIQGFFSKSCGTNCTASVRWKYRDVVYQVYAQPGEQSILVKIANSMIEAGER
jgi:hypothetical protein